MKHLGRTIRRGLLCLAMLMGVATQPLQAQDVRSRTGEQPSRGTVSGTVKGQSGDALAGATVALISASGQTFGAFANSDGSWQIRNVPAGSYTLRVRYVGYAAVEQAVTVGDGATTVPAITLQEDLTLNEVVVTSASRRAEKLTEAPAAISVLSARDFENLTSFNVGELAAKLQGVEFFRTGVNGVGINIRGFNTAFNAKVLSLTDGRNSMLAGSSGLPAGVWNTVIKEDVERVEVVLGPSSALYGPNAHNGIVNTITKDPRVYQGTDIAISAGTWSFDNLDRSSNWSFRMRQADKLSEKWAYKLTAEYTTGYDFEFRDSIYAAGAPGGRTLERNVNNRFQHIRGEAHVYYSLNNQSTIIATMGGSTNDGLTNTNVGRNQINDWQFYFMQLKYISPRWYATLYNTWTSPGQSYAIPSYTQDYFNSQLPTSLAALGGRGFRPAQADSFALRPGNRYVEQSFRTNAEVQYNNSFLDDKLRIVLASNYQYDAPRTYGTILADRNANIIIRQLGGAAQVEYDLPANFRLFGAARVDDHNIFGTLFAPKLGVIYTGLGGSIRATYGRAYAAPIILFQYAFLLNGLALGGGGENIGGLTYIPAGQTTPVTLPGLKPEDVTTYEVGYKGILAENKLFVDINAYYSQTENFLSPLITFTGTAQRIGNIPITPASPALFLAYSNYGQVNVWGADLGLNYYLSNHINAGIRYSYFDSDITDIRRENDANRDGYVSEEETAINTPKNRISGNIGFTGLLKGKLSGNLAVRWVEEFNFYSGNQIATNTVPQDRRGFIRRNDPSRWVGTPTVPNFPTGGLANLNKNVNRGPLGGFTTVDLSVGYKFSPEITWGFAITNLFNTTQREFAGAPSISRMYSTEIRFHFN